MWKRIFTYISLKFDSIILSMALEKVLVITFLILSSWTSIKEISSIVRIYTPTDPISFSFDPFEVDIISKLAPKARPRICLNLKDWNILKYNSYWRLLHFFMRIKLTWKVRSMTLQVQTPFRALTYFRLSSEKTD